MKAIRIIQSKRWKHTDGRTASIYGALPYYGNASNGWSIETVGYTTANDNGTVGNGRVPFKTLEDAQKAFPNVPVA